MKNHLHKLPFGIKLWWAKQLTYMFKGFGHTFDDDIILYDELRRWTETKGKPTTSSYGYQISKITKKIEELKSNIMSSPDQDPRDAYEIKAWKDEIVSLEVELAYLKSKHKHWPKIS
jgi:hypothetical protein